MTIRLPHLLLLGGFALVCVVAWVWQDADRLERERLAQTAGAWGLRD